MTAHALDTSPRPVDRRSVRARLREAERAENFPVALRVLPTARRAALRAVYDTVRTIDDLGDSPEPDPAIAPERRLVALDAVSADLARLWDGAPTDPHRPWAPVLARLAPVVADLGLPRAPFDDLVEANRLDQRVTRYATREELLGYCRLSAAPVGRLVLAVFEVPATPARTTDSDRVCAALQLLEHLGDVAEDRRRGRTYVPAEALAAGGVDDAALDRPSATFALRRVVLDETARARALLDAGSDLVADLHGATRLAVAGYVAGGRAAADALRRTGGDVLAHPPRTRRRDVARHLVAVASTVRGRA